MLDGGKVAQSFDVNIRPFRHEKVWGHSLDGSVRGKLGVVKVEPGGKLETEVMHYYKGSLDWQETIERTRRVSPAQLTALENMKAGLERWCED